MYTYLDYTHIFVCVCVFVYMCVCVCGFVCLCLCVCVYACVYVRVFVGLYIILLIIKSNSMNNLECTNNLQRLKLKNISLRVLQETSII